MSPSRSATSALAACSRTCAELASEERRQPLTRRLRREQSSRPHTRRGPSLIPCAKDPRLSFLRSGLEGRGLHERLEAMRNGWSWFATFASAGDLHQRPLALLRCRGHSMAPTTSGPEESPARPRTSSYAPSLLGCSGGRPKGPEVRY